MSQSIIPGDPVEQYLRLFEDDLGGEGLPSFNLRPIDLAPYLTDDSLRTVSHPWQGKLFFPEPVSTALPDGVFADSADGLSTGVPGSESDASSDVTLSSDGATPSGSDSTPVPETTTAEPDTLIHTVSQGETLFGIGQRYGVTVPELIEWNFLVSTTIIIGQRLIVIVEPENVQPDATEPDPAETDSLEPSIVETEPDTTSGRESPLQSVLSSLSVVNDYLDSIEFYTPVVRATFNNNIPMGQNDGALWQGRGVNTSLSFGTLLRYKGLEASIRPEIIVSQNREFELTPWDPADGVSRFGYSLSRIDYPQRFGDDSVTKIDPGQSWIRYNYRNFRAGLSTANLWAGPALHNPIQFSNNAPGFFHGFIETRRPIATPVGYVEGKVLWGRLKESDYFDDDSSNNLRFITSFIFNYSPSFVEGLHLGFARSFVKAMPNGEVFFSDYFMPFLPMSGDTRDDGTADADRLQMVSLFGRWRVPEYGFEFYTEWSRNTPSENARDFLMEPAFSRAYVLGFLKRFQVDPQRWLVLNFEMTHLENPRTVEFRPNEPYYLADEVAQGFTHKGQVIGAGIGPGSNIQRVGVSFFDSWGMAGLSFSRVEHDIERLYRFHDIIGERPRFTFNPRELNQVEFRYGLQGVLFLPYHLELQLDLNRSKFFQYRHQWFMGAGLNGYNTNLQVTVRYNLPGFLR